MRSILILFTLIILSLTTVGCGSGLRNYGIATSPDSEVYPNPLQKEKQTAYPFSIEGNPSSTDALDIAQNPNLGSVNGTLLLKGEPVVNISMYLGTIIADDSGRELVAGYDRTSLLRASTDENGIFIINNVPEGRYGLIVDLVTQAYLLDTPEGNQSIIFSVTNGRTTDLGILNYQELPGIYE